MAEREMVSLVWHRRDLQIELGYVNGDRERWIGSDIVAATLAGNAGLSPLPATEDAVRWVRQPEPCAAISGLRRGGTLHSHPCVSQA